MNPNDRIEEAKREAEKREAEKREAEKREAERKEEEKRKYEELKAHIKEQQRLAEYERNQRILEERNPGYPSFKPK